MVMASSMSGQAPVAHLAAHALERQAGVLVDDGHAHAGVAALGRHVQSARGASRRAGEFHAQAAGLGPARSQRAWKPRAPRSEGPHEWPGRGTPQDSAPQRTQRAAKCSGAPAPGGRSKGNGDGAAEATALAAKTPAAAKAAIPVKRIARTPSALPVRGRHTGGALRRSFRSRLAGDPAAASSNRIASAHSLRRQLSPSRRDSCPLFHGDG